MGKVIQFKQATKRLDKANLIDEYINLEFKIEQLAEDIELSESYNEFYKHYKTEEEYNRCNEDIEDKKDLLDLMKIRYEFLKEII
ncbi:hypothetical protein JHL18_00685 [Clostridium sp. YIM B02505]|uniref:Uncharacterized protein n=1 Tax=Clostridium yunnanense TaxID=2800325 RepID=A0ABS1EIG0_9CLOT|nr:hypothetical protein [Clostridium yunnanense]MBK1809164.1 hypothetical protein [Clostridium yunnanense]